MLKIIERLAFVLLIAGVVVFGLSVYKTKLMNDTQPPEITMDSDSITVSVDEMKEDMSGTVLAGVKAMDAKDGDVSDLLVVQGLSNFISDGRRKATIVAFDKDNNVSKTTREVVYSDYTSPEFSLEAPLRYATNNTYTIASDFKVEDVLDGDLSDQVSIEVGGDFATYDAGEYGVTYSVTNSAGDIVQLPVTVTYYDPSEDNRCPHAVLSDYLIYVKAGKSVSWKDYLTGLSVGGTDYTSSEVYTRNMEGSLDYSMSDVSVSAAGVDLKTPGVYEVIYSVTNEDEAYTSNVRLIVVVQE